MVLLAGWPKPAAGQGIVVDHTSLPLFEQIPEEYLIAAANLQMMFADRSVGANISDGLTCLGYESDEAAPARCKGFTHVVSAFSSPAGEVNWYRPGGYDRSNWTYFGWPGSGIAPELSCGVNADMWWSKLECFIRYVDANPTRYQVYSYQNSYLEVVDTSDIASGASGYFVSHPERYDITDFEAMEARHPGTVFLHHTSSLARGIGTQVARDFNAQMRAYARANNKFLLDVADIESHDPWGNPCYDNRDGIAFNNGNNSENYPNDGINTPAICQHYTREADGGHLGNPDVGKIRLAKAFWILMARVAGWNPDGGSAPDDLIVTTSSLPNGTVGQTYSALLGAAGGSTPYSWSVISGALPAGLSLNSATGAITGTPTVAATSSFTVRVADAQTPADTDIQALQITVLPGSLAPLNITTTSLPNARRNKNYSSTLGATGGLAPYTWSVVAGSLPAGFTLNPSTGVISGRSSTVGTYSFTVRARDSQATPVTDMQALTIAVR
jgi:hypothetical protein